MTIRIAAIEVSHWHALNDAAYLRHLIAMSDVELVAIQDSDASLVARRAAEEPADFHELSTDAIDDSPQLRGGARAAPADGQDCTRPPR
jgi:hypothetical protein